MCLVQGPQRSDAGEARTRGPTVSSQALYHWATALPDRLLRLRLSKREKKPHQTLVILKYYFHGKYNH